MVGNSLTDVLRRRGLDHAMTCLVEVRDIFLILSSVFFSLVRCLLQVISNYNTANKNDKKQGFMSRTITEHVRFKSLYDSKPSSAKQQREMTKFCVFAERRPRRPFVGFIFLEFIAGITYLV